MNKSDLRRNYWMLDGRFARKGYDWWWHNFTAINEKTGEERTFFIEYFTCNPALADQKNDGLPVLGQLEENKKNGIRPSYLMVKCGWWGDEAKQLHRFIPWSEVSITSDSEGYHLSAEDCSACETKLTGSVEISQEEAAKHPEWMCDSASMSWDIQIDKKIAFNVGYGAGRLFRKLKAFEMYWHVEGMKSLYSGRITANGEDYIVKAESSFGYADKNWGENFTSPWVWLSSCDLVSRLSGKRLEDSAFDIGGGRPKAFGIAMNRKLLSDFWYEGKSYEFNFSKFWTFCRTKFDCKERDDKILWYVRQETSKAVMETSVECEKSKMLLFNYESPDGAKRHNRLWNGGSGRGKVKLYRKKGLFGRKLELIDDIEAGHIGCEWGEYC
ncbi:MAG: hypothetical protein K5829_08125 [Treponema sp.]|nr:hypothetical protein [Treponema sp.]